MLKKNIKKNVYVNVVSADCFPRAKMTKTLFFTLAHPCVKHVGREFCTKTVIVYFFKRETVFFIHDSLVNSVTLFYKSVTCIKH